MQAVPSPAPPSAGPAAPGRHDHAGGHGHEQGPRTQGSSARRRVSGVLALTLGFSAVEAVGGMFSGSLALLADAGHMLADTSALALTLVALWLMARDSSPTHTYGFRRAEVLGAFLNAMLLVGMSVWIVVEAVERFYTPHPVRQGLMLLVALGGLLVNAAGYGLLHRAAGDNLTIRAALWHVVGDLLGSVGAVAAALVIAITGWTPIDPLLGILIAALIGISGAKILLDSTNLLLDSVPKQIDSREVSQFLSSFHEVRQICDLHIWGITSSETMLTAHLVIQPGIDRERFQRDLLSALHDRFHLAHMTVQLEADPQSTCRPEW